MGRMSTLHEIAVKFARKQAGMADSLTEEAPILKRVRWKPATHGMWNVAEKLTDVRGPGFVEGDAPLPLMHTGSDLIHTDLHVLGGMMEVPTMRAQKFGGAARYFADRQETLLKVAGMTTERQLLLENWLKAARAAKNLKDAGGKGQGWFIVAVRFDELLNVGLFDPDQFDQGRLLKIAPINGGNEYPLDSPEYKGVLGYGVAYRGSFGWQNLDPKLTCAAVVNIDENNAPTVAMIDDLLADVRSQPGSTFLFCSPKAKTYGINPHKVEHVRMTMAEKGVQTMVESWNGIEIVTSHNFNEKMAHVDVK